MILNSVMPAMLNNEEQGIKGSDSFSRFKPIRSGAELAKGIVVQALQLVE